MEALRRIFTSHMEQRAITKHRSRIGWRQAPAYTNYLDRCRREAPQDFTPDQVVELAVGEFSRDGFSSFRTDRTEAAARSMCANIEAAGETAPWSPQDDDGYRYWNGNLWSDFPEIEDLFSSDIGDFLRSHFKSSFKIFYGSLYRTTHVDNPSGSQLWHSDGGPGICVNVMFYLHDTPQQAGALEVLPWKISERIFVEEKKLQRRGQIGQRGGDRRKTLTDFYKQRIDGAFGENVTQLVGRQGSVVPFSNNTLHRGGYPSPGQQRTAAVFHCYPSHQAIDLQRYRRDGIPKRGPYPKDPASNF